MAAQKVYQIQINGLTESVKAVDALNESLKTLEARIKALEGKSVSVGSKSSGGGSSKASSLSEEEKLQKQINQLEEKRVAYSKEVYQNYLAAKDVLKETVKDQQQLAAAERVQANTYSNTMEGIKQKLADLKSVHFTTDISTDEFKKQTEEINELTNKLKKLEEEYGNYTSAADGFQKISINVGGTVREFNNAREASRTLNNELKAMAVNGQTNTEQYKKLRQAVMEIESAMNDAKKPMDNLMDAMESFTAIASVGQGLSALFGIDDTEIQRSIQKLVALQNILKGIETINKQINTKEGIGKWIAPFNSGIDTATKKALVFNKALLGTGKVSKAAATGIKLFSKALKVAFSAGILIVVDLLVEKLMDLVDSFKKVDKASERTKEIQEEAGKAYAEASAKISIYKQKVDSFNGSKKQEKKLVEELNKELGDSLGSYKTLAEWKDVLRNKTNAYIESMILEAKQQAILNQLVAAYQVLWDKRKNMKTDLSYWEQIKDFIFGAGTSDKDRRADIQKVSNLVTELENKLEEGAVEINKIQEKYSIGNYAPQIEKNGKKTKDAVEKTQDEINKKQIEAMRDGLNKTLMQLDEEERQTINKIKKNGGKTADEIAKVNQLYNAKRTKAILEYLTTIQTSIADTSDKIAKTKFEINIKGFEQQIKDLQNDIDKLSLSVPISQTLTTSAEYRPLIDGVPENAYIMASTFDSLKEASLSSEEDLKEYLKFLDDWNKELGNKFGETYTNVDTGLEEIKVDYDSFETWIEGMYAKELYAIREYGKKLNKDLGVIDTSLNNSFQYRIDALRAYNEDYIDLIGEKLKEQEELEKSAEIERYNSQQNELDHQYQVTDKALKNRIDTIEDALAAIGNLTKKSNAEISENDKKTYKDLIKALEKATDTEIKTYADFEKILKEQQETANYQLQQNEKQYYDKYKQNMKAHKQRVIEIERQTDEKIKQNKQKYYDEQISNYRDFINKLNEESSKNTVTDKQGWGVVMALTAKENYREILAASETTIKSVLKDKEQLNKDYKNGLIDPAAYNATLKELNDIQKSAENAQQTVKEKQKMLVADFVQSIQMYLQEVMNSFNTIMNAVWDAQDVAFDKEQEQLDKDNEKIKELLDEQENEISKHKSAIDSIEDELANSRGDRRQHLIDQLNAEMEAERAAQKEKERLAKLEEANKKKQEKLDKDRKKAQYKRDLIQAIVNGAMAVTYAAINTWPIPAIPMMALAGATTAAQIAIMSANKPYAKGGQLDGGVAQGPRHRDGGIKVLGGRAEIEGGEFITNRLTTEKNVDLLEFINSKKKRIDVNDLIDFYSSGTIKKSIMKMSPKKAYADGGYIPPTLSTNIDLDDRLMSAFENYSNRPVVVSVVDITNKQDDVRRVQALAGL